LARLVAGAARRNKTDLLQGLLDATRNHGSGHYGAGVRLARFSARAGEQFDDVSPRYHANRDALLVAYYD
jgi:hypothetical protein